MWLLVLAAGWGSIRPLTASTAADPAENIRKTVLLAGDHYSPDARMADGVNAAAVEGTADVKYTHCHCE